MKRTLPLHLAAGLAFLLSPCMTEAGEWLSRLRLFTAREAKQVDVPQSAAAAEAGDERLDVDPAPRELSDPALLTAFSGLAADSGAASSAMIGGQAYARRPLQSDHAFDGFISPLTNPAFFEDPRSLTELRLWFMNQTIPESNGLLAGGDFQVYALQARLALTERLSFIAVKDGYISAQPDAGVPDAEGWADVAAGLKYALVRNPDKQFLLSAGFTYEIDLGAHRVFQGTGDGIWNPFLSAGWEFCPRTHYLTTFAYRLPNNGTDNSQSFIWSHHVDRQIGCRFYPAVELHWLHYTKSGEALPINFEGGDLINLGSADVAGNDLAVMAAGFAYKVSEAVQLAVAYEFPVSSREDILDERLTCNLILRY